MSIAVDIPYEQIADFCKRWKVSEFALFGSVLRNDFRDDSDIDIMITHTPDAKWTLFDVVDMIEALEGMFGRKVDLVNRQAVEKSHNDIRRNAILTSARAIHKTWVKGEALLSRRGGIPGEGTAPASTFR